MQDEDINEVAKEESKLSQWSSDFDNLLDPSHSLEVTPSGTPSTIHHIFTTNDELDETIGSQPHKVDLERLDVKLVQEL